VLDLLLTGGISVLYDDRILGEYHEVIARPRLRIDRGAARVVLDFVERTGELVPAPPLRVDLPDASDVAFVEVAAAGGAAALVTGNGRHFSPARFVLATPIVTPAEFLSLWRAHEEG
jgi:predicted nucleic acid-binding protein